MRATRGTRPAGAARAAIRKGGAHVRRCSVAASGECGAAAGRGGGRADRAECDERAGDGCVDALCAEQAQAAEEQRRPLGLIELRAVRILEDRVAGSAVCAKARAGASFSVERHLAQSVHAMGHSEDPPVPKLYAPHTPAAEAEAAAASDRAAVLLSGTQSPPRRG